MDSGMVDSAATRKTFMVPDIKPLDQYDFSRAKICASLGWLLAKAYGTADSVPAELQEPFYRDQYEQEHMKPPVTRLLLSGELYCRACGQLLAHPPDTAAPQERPPDTAALLCLLAKRGLPPRDQEGPVTEADLQHKPIRMNAHLAVIDALMSMGAMETVRMVCGAEQLGGGAWWEKALLCWLSQVNQKLRESSETGLSQRSPPSADVQPGQSSCPSRWYWKLVPNRYRKDKLPPRQTPALPLVTGVKDLSDGAVLAAVIHFYCPGLLSLEDVCLKETMTTTDSLYNLQLIREFCDSCLSSCCPLLLEDLHYSPPALRVNILSLVAELLRCFELRRPDFVQPLQMLDLTDFSGLSDHEAPAGRTNSSASPSCIFKQPFLPISSPPPAAGVSGSTSMPHVEGVGRTWSKKPFSRPLSAVSFSVPFGLDSDVDVVMGNPVITRSVSSDSLALAVPPVTRAPYTPPEDLSHPLSKAPGGPSSLNGPVASPRASWGTQPPAVPLRVENGLGEELPTIEEALQIIHDEGRLEPRLHPEGAADGFYLHSPDGPARGSPVLLSSSAPPRSGMLFRRTSDGSRDDDSVLRDGSVDSDASEDLPKTQPTPATPATPGGGCSTQLRPPDTPDSGVKMTSFAERRKKQVSSTPPIDAPPSSDWAPQAEDSPSSSPALSSEMTELGARLEEKRRAIEAQKKRIEAIFEKHRQRLGKSALLQLKKQQGGGGEPGGEGGGGGGAGAELSAITLEERLARMEDEEQEEECAAKPPPQQEQPQEGGVESKGEGPGGRGSEKGAVPEDKGAAPLGDYNDAVSRLTAALSSLQCDMQRLSQQQNQLIRKKATPPTQAWVIPTSAKPSAATATPPRLSRESTRDLASPSPSRKAAGYAVPPKSPQAPHRRAPSAPPKSPKHQARPLDLKLPPLARVLTPPQNVDTLPHLRRVTPSQCQVQTSSSFSIGAPRAPRPAEDSSSETGSADDPAIFSLELEGGPTPVASRREPGGGGSSSGAPSECSFESDVPAAFGGKRSSLIEISLSSLPPADGDDADAFSDSMSDHTEPETRVGLGFFFKDEARPEDEMAQRRAALLEKQQKRAEELKRRRQEQEREREASRPSSTEEPRGRSPAPSTPSTPPPPREALLHRRGDFTRQEYQRRQQLKIMEDLDKVLRQKPTTVRGVKKQRPKTVFRDDSALSRSPAKGFMGSKISKVYSHSTLNLSSLANDSSNSGSLSVRKSPSRSHSPCRLMSPGRLANHNGEKDWDAASTISSPASVPEYTGPKLYKEPSFKSNKFIIHNALSRCCLAGKVNEPQKVKILEEMEKCTANHFLILFRDSSCQFRAVYTMNPETQELVRLTGIGPRVVSASVVESIYKYSSDRKQFTAIPSKTMSMSVDAFTIPGHLWQSKRPVTPKKPGTPK
ncbi:calmodulin-regulated spectrin-associated protein 3 [Megalops cyprinoides]|uniref:calmodulin-regulated spectrin-associated protein 3 n=1 Tax=Megalops cyprinoides TaxID=118141 RepID=UPI0018652AEA|nr:calmodulin-regulated spectrin-associated protein 3 [Megalops cyprinoides]